MSAVLRQAITYVARGWRVFPRRPRGKAPLTTHGFKDASMARAQITRWWAESPEANVAIACGASGLVVLDVDPRNEGADTLVALEGEHGPLPQTPTVLTGGSGAHYFFAAPNGVSLPGKLGAGVDLKGVGGYVVAPPSLHPSGNPYNWRAGIDPDDVPLAPCPEWVANSMKAEAPPALMLPILRHS